MAETNPTKQGLKTSEGKLTAAAMILGAVLEGLSVVLHSLPSTDAPWFPMALAVVGMLLQVCSLFGYQKARATIKGEMIAAGLNQFLPKPPEPEVTVGMSAPSPKLPSST